MLCFYSRNITGKINMDDYFKLVKIWIKYISTVFFLYFIFN
ncbi:Uncharacterised protein [Yersinia intermedia]|nr:Uncharacterised protein [Yersinia intermedia]